MLGTRNRVYVVAAALLVALTMTQCAAPTPAAVPTPQVIEKVVTKEVPKEVVVTKEVSKEVIVTKEVKVPADLVTIRTNWLYSGIHAWLFYGREKGYFREQNIELDIREGNGSGNVVRTVINKGDDFALVSIGNPIISTAQGAPLKIHTAYVKTGHWETGKLGIVDGLPAIGCADGLLVFDELQPPGKGKMPGKAFLAGGRKWE